MVINVEKCGPVHETLTAEKSSTWWKIELLKTKWLAAGWLDESCAVAQVSGKRNNPENEPNQFYVAASSRPGGCSAGLIESLNACDGHGLSHGS